MAFSDILQTIAEETDRTTIQNLATKYPSIREFVETGEHARKLEERLKAFGVTNLEQGVEYVRGWKKWKDENWDSEAKMTREEKAAKENLVQIQARLNELEARQETDMTPEEVRALVDEQLNGRKIVTEEDLNTLLPKDRFFKDGKPALVTTEDVERRLNGVAMRFQSIYEELTPQLLSHEKTFGEPVDVKKIFATMDEEFAKSRRLLSATEAYQMVYGPKYTEREKAAQQKAVEDAKAAGIAEGEKKGRLAVQQSQGGGRGMPAGGGSAPVGAVMKRVASRQPKSGDGSPIEAPLGKGIIAAVAAQQHMEKADSAATQ